MWIEEVAIFSINISTWVLQQVYWQRKYLFLDSIHCIDWFTFLVQLQLKCPSIWRIKSVAISQSDYFPKYLFPFEEKLVRMLCYLLQPEQKNIISINQDQSLVFLVRYRWIWSQRLTDISNTVSYLIQVTLVSS